MSIAPLLTRLRETARADIDRRLDDARASARRAEDAAAADLERRHEHALADRQAALDRDRDRELGAARDVAARETLAASERLIMRVLGAARVAAADYARQPAASAWLARTLAEAASFLPDGPATARTGIVSAPTLPGVTMSPAEFLGVMVESADHRVLVDASFERFLRAERARLAQDIMRRLDVESP